MSYQPFVEELIKALVDQPTEVVIEEEFAHGARTFFVTVHPDDVGKVIGKSGRVVTALRNVVSAVAAKSREKAFVKIVTE